MDALHITEIELARDVHGVLARLRAGEEVVIEGGDRPLVLRASEQPQFRTIGDAIAGLEAAEKERGYPLRMGKEFADDLEEIMANRAPRRPSAWD